MFDKVEMLVESVCVFCGALPGSRSEYHDAAKSMATKLAGRQLRLVFGGGSVGMMGLVADAMIACSGDVIGVIPRGLAHKELMHPGVADMRVVPTMHARKAMMSELSDAFVALPGGYGTLEELFEIITWAQLGIHAKPIGLLNVDGYFDPLLGVIDHMVEEGYVRSGDRDLFVVSDRPDDLLDRLDGHRPPVVRRWMTPDST